jgi:hypothetical protein
MTSESQYKRLAVASLNSIEDATDLSDKVGLLIMASGFFDDVHCRRQLHPRFTSRRKIRARLDSPVRREAAGHYRTSHAFGFFGGSPHSHLPLCEL